MVSTIWLLTLSLWDSYFLLKIQLECTWPASGDGLQQYFPYHNSSILITQCLQVTVICKRGLKFSASGAWFHFNFLAEQWQALRYGCTVHVASRPEKLRTGKVEEGSNLCHRCWLIACRFGHLCNGLTKERLTVLGGETGGAIVYSAVCGRCECGQQHRRF